MMMKINRQKITGFSLLEALIATIVLSVGLLGMAGLQGMALRNNHSAYLRSQAVVMAYDMMDRMRANKAAATSADYDRSYGDGVTTQSCSSYCAADKMADADVKEWVAALARLPSGDGSIAVTNTGLATINVQWDDDRDTATPDLKFQLTTLL